MYLLFNMLSRFLIAFLPRSKHLLISWHLSPSTLILQPKKIKSVTASTFSPSICYEVMGLDAMILVFWMLSFKPPFFTKRLLSFSSLSAIRVVSSAHLRLSTFLPAILIPACDSFSPAFCMMYSSCVCAQLLSCVQLFVNPWTIAYQTPLSVGFAWQEYWTRWPFPSLRDLLHPGTEPTLPALVLGLFTREPPEKPIYTYERTCFAVHLKHCGSANFNLKRN